MENQKTDPTNFVPKPSASKSWLYMILVLIIGIAAAAYFFYLSIQDTDDTQTTITVKTNNINTSNVNSNSNLNANSNASVIDNTNTNSANLNTANVNSQPTETTASTTKVITFQRNDHGLQLTLPTNWRGDAINAGTKDYDTIISLSFGALQNYQYALSGDVSIRKKESGDTLDKMINAKRAELERSKTDTNTLTMTAVTSNAAGGSTFESSNEYQGESKRTTRYAYYENGNWFYIVTISAVDTVIIANSQPINQVLGSLRFIDPLPVISLVTPAKDAATASNASYALAVDWQEPAYINLVEAAHTNPESASREYYHVGIITNGTYKDSYLVNIIEDPQGPAFRPDLFRVIYNPTARTIIYLEKHSGDLQYIEEPITYDTKSTIADFTNPGNIIIPNSTVSLTAELLEPNAFFSAYTSVTKVFTANGRDVYYDSEHKCFALKTADGLIKLYHYKLPFTKNVSDREYYYAGIKMVPDITWTGGAKETGEYTFNELMSGCGNNSCHAIFTDQEIGGIEALKQTGTTSTGDAVYEFKDNNNQMLKDQYDSFYVPEEETKISYNSFVTKHPTFFWKDPFGNWLKFKNINYLTAAECGKPVIYLYPEKTTKVNVKVQPNGGFSVTEPEYPDGGWTVTAQPNGHLRTEDGTYYPYLFWEGIGFNYQMPSRGFVVARNDVNKFLKDKLALLGLNAKESADFIEFWQAKLEVKPYVFVTFIDQPVFDQLAPLTVTPKPDQVIRVFMDYKPLDTPVSVQPLTIKTPVRHGFTVVEWGGALHR
jgi:uncharacterized protein (UPF0333 family)